jgi:hypothetical protein
MKRTTIKEYVAPKVEALSVEAEKGFALSYGDAGHAGKISESGWYEL